MERYIEVAGEAPRRKARFERVLRRDNVGLWQVPRFPVCVQYIEEPRIRIRRNDAKRAKDALRSAITNSRKANHDKLANSARIRLLPLCGGSSGKKYAALGPIRAHLQDSHPVRSHSAKKNFSRFLRYRRPLTGLIPLSGAASLCSRAWSRHQI